MSRLCSLSMEFFKSLTLSKFLKGIVLATLLAVFGYFGKDVLVKFTNRDTSFSHSESDSKEEDGIAQTVNSALNAM